MTKKTIAVTEGRIKSLARRSGTPILVVSRAALKAQVDRFRRDLPRVQPFYAIKANPHPEILKAMAPWGVGFNVASIGEIEAALEGGAKSDKLIFANTVKPAQSIRDATKKGVNLMTFDGEQELDKIAENAPGARVIVRIKVPNIGSMVELSLKFGIDPADAIPLLIKAHRLGLRPAGVSFHVGSQCTRIENYVEALEMAAIIIRDARLKQLPIDILDIGGIPIRHFDDDPDYFGQMAPAISREIDRLFDPSLKIIAEPGRFMVGPAATLILRVIGCAIRENKHWYYLDDGVYGALSGQIFDHAKYQFKVLKKGKTLLSTLAGPTCDSLDIIARGEQFPPLDVGDIVYAENVGEYSSASSTAFNGIQPARVVVLP